MVQQSRPTPDQGTKIHDYSSVLTPGQMRILSAFIPKGGTGKSTFSQHAPTVLAAMGRNVAVIDTDQQATASTNLIDLTTIPPSLRHSIADVVLDGVPLLEAMYQAKPNLWVVPADNRVNDASEFLAPLLREYDALKRQGTPPLKKPNVIADRLAELQATISPPPLRQHPGPLPPLFHITDLKPAKRVPPEQILTRPDYLDYIFFDHAPNPQALGRLCLECSGEIWVPVIPEPQAIEGLLQMLDQLGKLFADEPRRPVVQGIIPSRVWHQVQVHNALLFFLYGRFGSAVTRSVHQAAEIPSAQGEEPPQTAFEFARASRASKEWVEIALRIDGSSSMLTNGPECRTCKQIQEEVTRRAAAERSARPAYPAS